MKSSFGTEKLIKCLINLGFSKQPSTGSSHVKYKCPNLQGIPIGTRPFIIVIQGVKVYDKHTMSRYRTEIRRLGYSTGQIEEAMFSD